MKNKLICIIPLLAIPFVLEGCATIKPILRTLNDVAYDLCVLDQMAARPGLTAEDIGKAFCATEEALKPFLDTLLAAKKLRAAAAASASCPVPAPVVPPVPSAKPVPAAVPSAAPSAAPAAPVASTSVEIKVVSPKKAIK